MKNYFVNKHPYRSYEINLLKIVFLIAGITSPLITYTWRYFNWDNASNVSLGWAMAVLFFTIVILSYTSHFFKRYFIFISFLMFMISSISALYFTTLSGFNYNYTLLFFFVIFATTMFINKLTHLLIFQGFVFTLLLSALFYHEIDNTKRITIIFIYIILIIIMSINSFLINKKQQGIDILVSLIENINQNYSFNEILIFIYNNFSNFIPYDHIVIALIKEDGKTIEASYGLSENKLDNFTQSILGKRINTNETILKDIIETGKARIINGYSEYAKDKLLKILTEKIVKSGIKTSIALPFMINNKSVGIIFFSSVNKNVYTQEHIKFLETIVYSISISFEKCILLEDLIINNIMSLVKLAELRDSTTGIHLDRMKIYAKAITRLLYEDSAYKNDITIEYINDIEKFAPIHDIGKVGIQDGILLKPGKLTSIEFEEMKKHVIFGGEILRLAEKNIIRNDTSIFQIGIEITEGHHEKWDGTGYPFGKVGTDIPLSARIVAIADVFDALTTKRPYKEAFTFKTSFNIILEGKGKHFDPEIVRVLENNQDRIYEIYNSFGINM